ncbi:MAG: hypothetical protein NZ480_06890, partial [Bdellovibrionaceae bacterium]|nr:hypothetical protein [Pseudobdellovibrionaceae bacterium]
GPTHVKFGYRAWGDWVMAIALPELPCRPCHHHGPKACPLKHHQCMKGLRPDLVLKHLVQAGLLSR